MTEHGTVHVPYANYRALLERLEQAERAQQRHLNLLHTCRHYLLSLPLEGALDVVAAIERELPEFV